MELPLWVFPFFLGSFLLMLALNRDVFHRKAHVFSFVTQHVAWIVPGVAFGGLMGSWMGMPKAKMLLLDSYTIPTADPLFIFASLLVISVGDSLIRTTNSQFLQIVKGGD